MSNIQPKGEDLRKAVKWISEEHQYSPDRNYRSISEEACLKFNLSPMDAEYLARFCQRKEAGETRGWKAAPTKHDENYFAM
jgi:hypothetical protein